jgi:hypothetical protein
MTLHLSPCPKCERHVRVSEEACPFCGAALEEAFRGRAAPRAPRVRMGRAALYAFGTSAMTMAAACGGAEISPDAGPPIVDAAYGGPPVDGGGDARAGDADFDAMGEPTYGGPPWFDAAADVMGTAAYGGVAMLDGGADGQAVDADGAPPMVDAAYGGPPIDAGDQ